MTFEIIKGENCSIGRSASCPPAKDVEERLRTYMLAGIDPQELHNHAHGEGDKYVFITSEEYDKRNAILGFSGRGLMVGGTLNQFYSEDENGKMVEDFPPPHIAAKMGTVVDRRKTEEKRNKAAPFSICEWFLRVISNMVDLKQP